MPSKAKSKKSRTTLNKRSGKFGKITLRSRKTGLIVALILMAGLATYFTVRSFALDPDGPVYRRMATCTPSTCMDARVLGVSAFQGPANGKGTISYRLSKGGRAYTTHPLGGIKFTRNQSFSACIVMQAANTAQGAGGKMSVTYEGGLKETHNFYVTTKKSACIVGSHNQRPYDRAIHSVEVVNESGYRMDVFEVYIDHINIRTWDYPPVK